MEAPPTDWMGVMGAEPPKARTGAAVPSSREAARNWCVMAGRSSCAVRMRWVVKTERGAARSVVKAEEAAACSERRRAGRSGTRRSTPGPARHSAMWAHDSRPCVRRNRVAGRSTVPSEQRSVTCEVRRSGARFSQPKEPMW